MDPWLTWQLLDPLTLTSSINGTYSVTLQCSACPRALPVQQCREHQTSPQVTYDPIWVGKMDQKPRITQMKEWKRMCLLFSQHTFWSTCSHKGKHCASVCGFRALAFKACHLLGRVRTTWGVKCVTLVDLSMSPVCFCSRLTTVKMHNRDQ